MHMIFSTNETLENMGNMLEACNSEMECYPDIRLAEMLEAVQKMRPVVLASDSTHKCGTGLTFSAAKDSEQILTYIMHFLNLTTSASR